MEKEIVLFIVGKGNLSWADYKRTMKSKKYKLPTIIEARELYEKGFIQKGEQIFVDAFS